MRIIALTVCLFFAGSSACFAYGAIAAGLHHEYPERHATVSINQPSKADAERVALEACRAARYRNCTIVVTFSNTCASAYYGAGRDPHYYAGTDPSQWTANQNGVQACSRDGNASCGLLVASGACDRTPDNLLAANPPAPAVSSNTAAVISTTSSSGGGSGLEGLFGFLFIVGIAGAAFYWLYWRWTAKELPVQTIISAEETARDRSELKLLQEQSKLPPLPPPVLPERPPGPVAGIMRVDVTQTDKTVDVFVVLSEQAKFVIEKHGLGKIPIEENFDGLQAHLKEHLMRYSDDYDIDTKIGIQDRVEYRDPVTQAVHVQVMEEANRKYRADREAEKKYKLRERIRTRDKGVSSLSHGFA